MLPFGGVPALVISQNQIEHDFREVFRTPHRLAVFRAPGRVNLIGEHTDYNQGLVCPIALELSCYVAIAPATHCKLRIYSAELGETHEFEASALKSLSPRHDWTDYVVGVAQLLDRSGVQVTPADLYIHSEVPRGSGLSSSAALEVASALALLGSHGMDRLELAKLCQQAEVQFVGMPCGIMDQYASLFGREGTAILIDCRSLTHSEVRLPSNVRVIAVNSMVKHELATSAYGQRVAECRQAVAELEPFQPGATSLRDVPLTVFERFQDSMSPIPRKRARHIISENARVLDFAAAARSGDLHEMGRLFIAAHRSLQYDFEISCEEIDFLVDTAIKIKGVHGARMTGGGFGGCTVNLVDPPAAMEFERRITAAYSNRFRRTPLFYDCEPSASAGRFTP
jgi:galactokinase